MSNVVPLFPNSEERKLLAKTLPRVQRYLRYRERSPRELHQYLRERMKLSLEETQIIMDWVSEEGLIDLHRFTQSRIEHFLRKGKGPLAIRQELALFGVPLPVTKEFLSALTKEEITEAGIPKAASKLRQLRDKYENENEIQNRLYRYLQGRGFSFEESRRIYTAIRGKTDRNSQPAVL